MAKSNIPAVGPAISGQTGTNLIAGSSICDMIRSACPMLENIYCNEDPISGSRQIIAVNSCGDQKIVCSIVSEKGMTDDDVCKIVEEKTQEFLIEESICALIDGKINPFLTETQVCQLIASKSFNAESICAEIAERCPHVKEVNIFGKTLSVSFTNNAREVENFEIPCSSAIDNEDGTTTTIHPDGSEHTSVDSPVRTICGIAPDSFGNVDSVKAVNNGDGTVTITDLDGTSFELNLFPVMTVNGEPPSDDGNVDVETTRVIDNGDGTYTAVNSNGEDDVLWMGNKCCTNVGTVSAAGTVELPDGQIVPAVDKDGSVIESGSTIINFTDNEGIYDTSICLAEAVKDECGKPFFKGDLVQRKRDEAGCSRGTRQPTVASNPVERTEGGGYEVIYDNPAYATFTNNDECRAAIVNFEMETRYRIDKNLNFSPSSVGVTHVGDWLYYFGNSLFAADSVSYSATNTTEIVANSNRGGGVGLCVEVAPGTTRNMRVVHRYLDNSPEGNPIVAKSESNSPRVEITWNLV